MAQTVLRWVGNVALVVLTGALPVPRWVDEKGWSLGNTRFGKACALLLAVGLVGGALYNDYAMLRFGQVWAGSLSSVAGWISFGEAPTAYSVLCVVYGLISLAPVGWVYVRIRERRRNRQAAIRRFVEGGGPAPIVRRKEER